MHYKSKSFLFGTRLRTLCLLLFSAMLMICPASAAAEEKVPAKDNSHHDLAGKATNPLGNLMSIQLQYQYNWDNNNSDGYSGNFLIQPVVPIKLPYKPVPLLITRTTLPYVTTADLGEPIGRQYGVGDLVNLALGVLEWKPWGGMIALGTTLTIPTADNTFTGAGKWQLGPAGVYINSKWVKSWQFGMLGWQSWSISGSGDEDRADVSKLSFQPIVN